MKRRIIKRRDLIPVVLLPDAQFNLKEAYKTLRTNLQFLSVTSKIKSIIITSTQPMEGKTTLTVNLAIALSLAGNKVLVVDTDMRSPRIHKYIRIKAIPGVTNWLASNVALTDMVVETKYGFDVMPSGSVPPNPSELLGSSRMEELVKQAEDAYDYVLYDTPPAGLITDAAVLSKYVDGIIFAIRYSTTNIDTIRVAKESLEKVGARIIGSVITDVKDEGYKKSKYSDYGKYGYGQNNL